MDEHKKLIGEMELVIGQLKREEIGRREFFQKIVELSKGIDLSDRQLEGVIPFLVTGLNRLIKEIEKES